jgi:RNA polymerase sigma factor (sigma-70 family)
VATSTEDERELIEAARADPARFVEVYDRYVDRVYAYVSRRAVSRSIAEDITSEVFQLALANLPRFEWRGVPFAAWLYRMAANSLADYWRRQGREAQVPLSDLPERGEHEPFSTGGSSARPAAPRDRDAFRGRQKHPRRRGGARSV